MNSFKNPVISSKLDVEAFLSEMRTAIDNNSFIPVYREKNIETLARLGLTWADAKEEIKTLQYSNYISGPEADLNPNEPDPVWIFKKKVEAEVIYIKIKICHSKHNELKALSFHIDYM